MPGFNDGNVFHISDFDDALEQQMVPFHREIQRQRALQGGYIDVWVNSFGGYAHVVYQLVELFELAKRNGVIIRTMVPSLAASAGSMLAVAGSEGHRFIAKSAEHLVHYGSIGSVETTPTQIERYNAMKRRDFKNTLAHYKKYCNIPNIEDHLRDDGFYIIARDSLRWGLADHYIEKYDIGDYTE
jgi:ATP-dependent protease ClpP protease subunit